MVSLRPPPHGRPSGPAGRSRRLVPALALTVLLGVQGCHGQAGAAGVAEDGTWEPVRDVTIVVPFAAGGGSDIFARNVAAGLEEVRPEINIVVENRPGGSGAEGYGHFAAQAGDPHYLLAAEPVRNVLPQKLDVPFDWDDWTNIGQVVEDVGVLAVNSDAEWTDIDAFLAGAEEAAEEGRPFRIALPGAGGVDEVLLYLMEEQSGIEFEPVIYDGTGETNPALMSGDVEATILNPSDGRSEIQGEVFAPILGFAQDRLEVDWLADVPVAGELGWDINATKFRGLIAPLDVPDGGQEYWVDALSDAVETDAFQEYVRESGLAESRHWGDDWIDFLEDWNAEVFPVLERIVAE
ncbi:tripartite tricarboxylate transporter substrate binding protein [Spiractinospora alimapuensis]|uniref:tripartite tricarboxylate transporter substrate-binding protein n=1 Tax=Spiractinospora alimapuensis TaxID=2820884 RepID=UPI001F41E781|nr:tripartite tricarboxylate transporter substrate-binding protein [Spiractinospora alimapuensis]QVQ52356.1 tripartite tricarboxylate transporter substrate binding protein [Spiractinospora alimapuensis]